MGGLFVGTLISFALLMKARGDGNPFSLFRRSTLGQHKSRQNRFIIIDTSSGQSIPLDTPEGINNNSGSFHLRSERDADSGIDDGIFKGSGTTAMLVLRAVAGIAWFLVARSVTSKIISAGEKMVDGLISKSSFVPDHVLPFLHPNVTLNSYESEIAAAVIDPNSIQGDINRIGGLHDVKVAVWECIQDLLLSNEDRVVTSRSHMQLFAPVSGILLFGPPGCGKTLMAKSMAKRAGLPMLHVTPSLLLRKWVGDTSLLTRALFTLSQKIAPCILFIDEMDSLLRTRSDQELSVDRNLKTEFMQLWDELVQCDARVVIIGATNRPQDLDSAIQRRFERSFLVGYPTDKGARVEVLKAILSEVQVAQDFDWEAAAKLTEGYSPSDMHALCKAAAAVPLREYHRGRLRRRLRSSRLGMTVENGTAPSVGGKNNYGEHPPSQNEKAEPRVNTHADRALETPQATEGPPSTASRLRALTLDDLHDAAQTVFPTEWSAQSYEEVSGEAALWRGNQTRPERDGVGEEAQSNSGWNNELDPWFSWSLDSDDCD